MTYVALILAAILIFIGGFMTCKLAVLEMIEERATKGGAISFEGKAYRLTKIKDEP